MVEDVDDHLDLLLRMDVRSDASDPDFIYSTQAHIQIFGDVMILTFRNKTQFIVTEVDGDSIGVKGFALIELICFLLS